MRWCRPGCWSGVRAGRWLEFFSARRKIKKSVSVLFAAHVESLSTAARIVSLERYWAMSG
jgi:hypothetical protein